MRKTVYQDKIALNQSLQLESKENYMSYKSFKHERSVVILKRISHHWWGMSQAKDIFLKTVAFMNNQIDYNISCSFGD